MESLTDQTILRHEVQEVAFGFYSDDEIRALSVKQVTSRISFDALNNPVMGGLYDPAMGPVDFNMICPTCHQTQKECPGHLGHIELPVPVYNPILFMQLLNILKRKCFSCHKFRVASSLARITRVKILLMDNGCFEEAHALSSLLEQKNGDEDEPAHRTMARQQAILDEYERLALSKQSHTKQVLQLPRWAQVERDALVTEFAKGVKAKCENCGAVCPGIRQDNYAKVFLKPLSQRARSQNRAKNVTIRSALDTLRGNSSVGELVAAATDDDDAADDSEDDDGDEAEEVEMDGSQLAQNLARSKFLPPLEVQSQLQLMWQHEDGLMELLYGDHRQVNQQNTTGSGNGWKKFFLNVLPVAPCRFRPPVFLGDNQFEHAQNTYLSKILKLGEDILTSDGTMRAENQDMETEEDVAQQQVNLQRKLELWTELQTTVNCLVDSSRARPGADTAQGIRQVIEKKEGLFRKHMMGKRVNYAARSVISPDPYISTSQIGVPLRFAKTLTYPQPVTPWNIEEMRQLVINGPEVHPGANFVESESGRLIDLSKRTLQQREAISKTLLTRSASAQDTTHRNRVKRVWRHLRTGDVVLMNRQPTLHKPSMMAHVTRVLTNPKMQTIRMHYANCNTFNADFDGDEMNMHFPQNEIARAEAYHIAANDHQYLVPTDGSPLRGLIQDHVDSGVKLTKRDTFLTKDMYMQLLYNAWASMEDKSPANAHIEIVPPAILKPKQLWTGKQVVTSVLKLLTRGRSQLNLNSKAKIKGELFGTSNGEHIVVFRDGELLQGVLDKSQFGASEYGFVHACYDIYGAHVAADLLTTLGHLFTCYLRFTGHTCAMEDLTLTDEAEKKRRALVQNSVIQGEEAYAEYAGLTDLLHKKREEEQHERHGKKRRMNEQERLLIREKMRSLLCSSSDRDHNAKALDAHMMGCVHGSNSEIIKTCLPGGQRKSFPDNCFSLMVLTGAKGSMVNHSQISCGLGQQALEGRRVPMLVSGRSLPSFEPFDPAPRAGGYITDRFLTGLRPQEYYHHCMAGREGLVDTAVKTSRSGYLQRCLVKHLEDLQVHYDHTVRNSDGRIVQFLYGEDGVDPVQSAFLSGNDAQMTFEAMNHQSISRKYGIDPDFFAKTKLDIKQPMEMHLSMRQFKRHHYDRANAKLAAGLRVWCRRLKDGEKKWKRGRIANGWHEAIVLGLTAESEDLKFCRYDLQYVDTGKKAFNVPRFAHFEGRKTNGELQYMSGIVEIIKAELPDPVFQSLTLNNHVGTVSERIQEKIWSYNDRNPHNCLEMGAAAAAAAAKHKKKKKKKHSHTSADQQDDAESLVNKEVMRSSHVVSPDAFQLLMWVNYMRSLAHPGENVGTLAAQSIGEPSTQMTLNTFHLAGHGAANVTLGIPRLREIIMTASKKMSTPMMTIPFKSDLVDKQKAQQLERQLNQIALSELIANDSKGIWVNDAFKASENGVTWVREYTIRLKFFDFGSIKKHFGLSADQVFQAVGSTFISRLLTVISREMKKSGVHFVSSSPEQADGIGAFEERRKRKDHGHDQDHDDKDDDDESDDEEQGTLRFGKQKEMQGYGEMDEEDQQIHREQQQEDEDEVDDEIDEHKHQHQDDDQDQDQDDDEQARREEDLDMVPVSSKSKSKSSKSDSTKRELQRSSLVPLDVPDRIRKNIYFVYAGKSKKHSLVEIQLRFSTQSKTLLMVPLVEKVAQQVLVQSCPGISRCYLINQRLDKEQDERPCLQTEGLNFQEIWKLDDVLDVNQLATNDIYQVLCTFGVEAARASISKQINDVFGVYGINVDPRHLNLLADYMTLDGTYKPLNRMGMQSKGSSFQQITFETSMKFLTSAALNGLADSLESPSARIVLGLPPKVGTGSFSLLQPIQL